MTAPAHPCYLCPRHGVCACQAPGCALCRDEEEARWWAESFAKYLRQLADPDRLFVRLTKVHHRDCRVVLDEIERSERWGWDPYPELLTRREVEAGRRFERCARCAPDVRSRPRGLQAVTSGLGWPVGDGKCARNPLRRAELRRGLGAR